MGRSTRSLTRMNDIATSEALSSQACCNAEPTDWSQHRCTQMNRSPLTLEGADRRLQNLQDRQGGE